MKRHSFLNLGLDLVIFSVGLSLLTGITLYLLETYELLIVSAVGGV